MEPVDDAGLKKLETGLSSFGVVKEYNFSLACARTRNRSYPYVHVLAAVLDTTQGKLVLDQAQMLNLNLDQAEMTIQGRVLSLMFLLPLLLVMVLFLLPPPLCSSSPPFVARSRHFSLSPAPATPEKNIKALDAVRP